MKHYDVIIVGGGPAGIFSAIAARSYGATVLLIEKNNHLGKKLLISGGGRCNLSNISPIEKFIENIPGNGKFLYSAFSQFSNTDLINFFEKQLGIKLKVEDRGRVFPAVNHSKIVVNSLTRHLEEINVKILFDGSVQRLLTKNGRITGVYLAGNQIIKGYTVILATGGISYPRTGSTGAGYNLAGELGHRVTELFPASVPLNSDDEIIKDKLLQGLSLRNIELSLYNQFGKQLNREKGDMIFTHFGLSGPAVFRISRYVALALRENENIALKINIDLFPDLSNVQLHDKIAAIVKGNPQKNLLNGFNGLLPEKLLRAIIKKLPSIKNKKMVELNEKDINTFVCLQKGFAITISGTRPIAEATVTGGGISIKDVDPKTFSSKLINGLFIVGELLDIDGHTGGYNIQTAFTTGYVAGKSAYTYVSELDKDKYNL